MKTTRRHFLIGSLAALNPLTSGRGLRTASAGERIVLGFMGIRGRGYSMARGFAQRSDTEIAYLADVDTRLFENRAKGIEDITGKRPKVVQDFRRMLDDKSVDAIVMGTPDHWHALGTILACQAGKDVYVEKPTSHSIWESRKMVDAARKYQRVVQVGTQNRSAPYVKTAIEYLRSGKLGKVHFLRIVNSKLRPGIGRKPDSKPPDGVDYDMWLGPAPSRPFNENHFHYTWHWLWEYGGGDISNDGIHQIDIARWCANVTYPKSVSSTGGIHFYDDDQQTPDTHVVTWDFDGLTMLFEQTLFTPYMKKTPRFMHDLENFASWPFSGFRIEICGTAQKMFIVLHGAGWKVFDGDYKLVAEDEGPLVDDLHYGNFLDGIRNRARTAADIEEGHLSTLLCHYGNVAYRTERKLKIDPKTEGFLNDNEANGYLRRRYRTPWVVPDVV